MPSARIIAGLAAISLATGLSATVAVSSAAALTAPPSTDLLVSADGVHFSPALDGSLFEGSDLLVPGDSVAAGLWIRNPTAAPAVLRVSVRDVTISSTDMADGLILSAWNSGTDSTKSGALRNVAPCEIIVPSQAIAAGATMKMIVRFTMADLTSVTAQQENASLELMVAMRDGQAGPFSPSACDDDGVLISSHPARAGPPARSSLASTGTDFAIPLLATGGFLIGVGLFFVARRRREHDES